MSFKNFAPVFWATKILKDNAKLTVLANLANRTYEGEAKKGEKVKILGIGSVTVKDYNGTDIDTPEAPDDTSVYLEINKAKYFNVAIDDIDKAQSAGNPFDAVMAEANEAMSDVEDSDIGDTLLKESKLINKTSVTPQLARYLIINAKTELRKAGVKKSTKICSVVSPDFYEKLEIRNEELNTNNSSDLENGFDAKVSGVEIYVSNNIPKAGGKDVIFTFTKNRAFAHASGIDELEAYRPEKRFNDAVKGLHCYGTKVIRPKEIVAYSIEYQA